MTYVDVDQQFEKGSKTMDEILSQLVGVLIGNHSQQVSRTHRVKGIDHWMTPTLNRRESTAPGEIRAAAVRSSFARRVVCHC